MRAVGLDPNVQYAAVMDLGLEGKVALVTGSYRGTGAGVARVLAAEGVTVLVHGLEPGQAGGTLDAIADSNGRAHAVVGDIRTEDGTAALVFDGRSGYLQSVLEALHVPVSSQMLVMSKTGVQGLDTGPGNPRAILFTVSQLMADATNIVDTMGLRADWPNLGVISLAHSYGFSNLITPLLLHHDRDHVLFAITEREPRLRPRPAPVAERIARRRIGRIPPRAVAEPVSNTTT